MALPHSLSSTADEWKDQLRRLTLEVSKCEDPRVRKNTIIHFFLCALGVEFDGEFSSFLKIAERVIRAATEVEIWDARLSAAQAVRNVLRTEAFPADMLSRVTAEDVRNVIVSDLWRCHGIVVKAEMETSPPQHIPYHITSKLGTVSGDAQDAERLLNLLKWMNVSKRVVAVRRMLDADTPSDDDDTIFDTCAGYWWKSFVTKGTTRTVWENILDIAQYSFNDSDESI